MIVSRVMNSQPVGFAAPGMNRQILIQSPQNVSNLQRTQSQSALKRAPSVFEYQANTSNSTNWSNDPKMMDYERSMQEQYQRFQPQNIAVQPSETLVRGASIRITPPGPAPVSNPSPTHMPVSMGVRVGSPVAPTPTMSRSQS